MLAIKDISDRDHRAGKLVLDMVTGWHSAEDIPDQEHTANWTGLGHNLETQQTKETWTGKYHRESKTQNWEMSDLDTVGGQLSDKSTSH